MANTRIEMDLTKFLSMRFAMAAAHVIAANELFLSSKAVLDPAGLADDQAPLTGLTAAQAENLYTVVSNAASNTSTARTEMKKIDAGVDVG